VRWRNLTHACTLRLIDDEEEEEKEKGHVSSFTRAPRVPFQQQQQAATESGTVMWHGPVVALQTGASQLEQSQISEAIMECISPHGPTSVILAPITRVVLTTSNCQFKHVAVKGEATVLLPHQDVRPTFAPSRPPVGAAAAPTPDASDAEHVSSVLFVAGLNGVGGGAEQDGGDDGWTELESPIDRLSLSNSPLDMSQLGKPILDVQLISNIPRAPLRLVRQGRREEREGGEEEGGRKRWGRGRSVSFDEDDSAGGDAQRQSKGRQGRGGDMGVNKRLKHGKASELVEREREEWKRRIREREATREEVRDKRRHLSRIIGHTQHTGIVE